MKTIYFLLIIGFGCGRLLSQDQSINKIALNIEILKADTLVKGIYKDFNEFQNNNPSYKNKFTINKKNPWISYNYENIYTKKLLVPDSAKGLVPYPEDYWGICDGKRIYICYNGKLRILSIDGKYCQFSELQTKTQIEMNYSYPKDYNFILDATNNKIIRLSVNSLTEILQKEDINLLREFNLENDKKIMIYTYIDRLNKIYNYE